MVQTLFEKLFYNDEKNVLVQGLPFSIERNFVKIKFSKNVTPLLKKNKIDFVLLFAIDKTQLDRIIPEVLSAIASNGKLWIAFPKQTSKILSNLSKNDGWGILTRNDYQMVRFITIDHVWSAARFDQNKNIGKRLFPGKTESPFVDHDKQLIKYPEDLQLLFEQFVAEQLFFESLSFNIQKDFILWLNSATNLRDRESRLKMMIEKFKQGEFVI